MPYFQEWFINSTAGEGQWNSYAPNLIVTDQVMMTTHRSRRPHSKAISFREISDVAVDPYAHFLVNEDERRYFEALKSRGISARLSPDRGHPFELVRHQVQVNPIDIKYFGQNFRNAVVGYSSDELNDVHNGDQYNIPSYGDISALDTFGRQAYARVAPSSVVFDAANFLGELRERLPSLALQTLRDQSRFFRSLGSDYLNFAFGWKPFIDDLIRAGNALYQATLQLSSDGHSSHRRFGLPPFQNSRSITAMSSFADSFSTGLGVPGGLIPSGFPMPKTVLGYATPLSQDISGADYNTRFASKQVERFRWFEGMFTSFYPLGFDPSSYLEKLNVLVNTRVTPEVLWNLTPWTWLVDWNLKIGDSIRANQLRANDLLIMHYGYAMEQTVYTTTSYFENPSNNPPNTIFPAKTGMIVRTTRKRRIRANPYGFGIGGAGALSAPQLAILGALGLTKLG